VLHSTSWYRCNVVPSLGARKSANDVTDIAPKQTSPTSDFSVCIDGKPQTAPLELVHNYVAWGMGGRLLTPILQKIGRPEQVRARARVEEPEDHLRQPPY
jgi:hypothetical protein